jgi:hypothetical protein
MSRYRFSVASTADEFDQIHRLNYRTFVDEIPQHEPNRDHRLVDRFHDENTYVVCKDVAGKVVGMICVRDRRPFSVDQKIGPFEDHLPEGVERPRRPCEIRLLAIEPGHRHGRVILGLLGQIIEIALERGYDLALMSGRPANMRLYRALGLRPFGPLTGSSEVPFQPMYASMKMFYIAQRRGRIVAALPETMGRLLADVARPARPRPSTTEDDR